uniref:Uncharacterized protein n=1 Tax=Archaeoglobus fulgidus TaxID=2234 RepID=A0A7C2SD70_ARCFL
MEADEKKSKYIRLTLEGKILEDFLRIKEATGLVSDAEVIRFCIRFVHAACIEKGKTIDEAFRDAVSNYPH